MYFLFGYDYHYPSGGMQDYIGSTDNIEDAKKMAKDNPNDVYEIVVKYDGDYLLPAYLKTILTGESKRVMKELTIRWQNVD
jgi:hypothetical protein